MTQRERFEAAWDSSIQYCRAGGGDYEKSFAYRAWQEAERQTIELLLLAIRTGVQEDDFTDDADHDSGILHGLRIAERIVRALGEEE